MVSSFFSSFSSDKDKPSSLFKLPEEGSNNSNLGSKEACLSTLLSCLEEQDSIIPIPTEDEYFSYTPFLKTDCRKAFHVVHDIANDNNDKEGGSIKHILSKSENFLIDFNTDIVTYQELTQEDHKPCLSLETAFMLKEAGYNVSNNTTVKPQAISFDFSLIEKAQPLTVKGKEKLDHISKTKKCVIVYSHNCLEADYSIPTINISNCNSLLYSNVG